MGNSVLVTDGTAEVGSESGRPSYLSLFNGTDWDAQRGNTEGIALASAARTAQVSSADITNYNARGVLFWLDVTAVSGTGGLKLRIQQKDPVSGKYHWSNAIPTVITATGVGLYAFYPGGISGLQQSTSSPLARTFNVTVQVVDASSYTYSVGYCLVN